MASLYDLMGKYSPILEGLNLDLRKVTKNTIGWDDLMSAEFRNTWLENFWKFEQLRGLQFNRARMPLDALDEKTRLITIVDAAMEILMVGVWVGFRRPGGVWSLALLADEESTTPRWVVKQALGSWVESSVLAGECEIALCLTTDENTGARQGGSSLHVSAHARPQTTLWTS